MKPVSAKFENFLCYVDEEIDFESLPPIVCITGLNADGAGVDDNNGAGKSALVDGPAWATYGRVRGNLNKQLVNTDVIHIDDNNIMAEFARVTYEFAIDKYYKVMREITATGKQTLEFYTSKDRKIWNCLTLTAGVNRRTGKKESSISRTQQRINDVLNCNCDLFINSIYFEQGNTHTFATSKPAQREELLKDALYLDEWADFGKEAKARNRKLEKEIYAVEYALEKNNVEHLNEKIKEYEASIEAYDEQIDSTSKDLKGFEKKLLKSQTTLSNIESKVEKYNDLVNSVNDIAENYESKDGEVVELDSDITEDVSFTSSVAKKITIQKDLIRQSESLIGGLELDWSQAPKKEPDQSKLEVLLRRETEIQLNIQNFEQGKADVDQGSCPIKHKDCDLSSCENKTKKKKQLNAQIFKLKAAKVKKTKEVKSQRDENKKRENDKTRLQKIDREISLGKSALKEAKMTISHLTEKRESIETSLKKKRNQRTKLSKELESLKSSYEKKSSELEAFGEIPDVDKINVEVSHLEETLKLVRKNLEESKQRKSNTETNLKITQKTLDEMDEYRKKHLSLTDKKRMLEYTVKILTKEIPHQLIEAAIPEIENYAREFMYDISNGRYDISFVTQREIQKKDKETKEKLKSDTLEIMVEIDGKELKYAQTSGGQRARADIAIHLGYSAFLLNRSGARLESLFLDEVASALDKTGKEALISLIGKLIKEYGFKQVFLISQDERLNRLFDTIVTVKRTTEGSKICYSTQNT